MSKVATAILAQLAQELPQLRGRVIAARFSRGRIWELRIPRMDLWNRGRDSDLGLGPSLQRDWPIYGLIHRWPGGGAGITTRGRNRCVCQRRAGNLCSCASPTRKVRNPALYDVHPLGPVRHQGQLRHQAHPQGRSLVAARIYHGAPPRLSASWGRRRVVSLEDGSSASTGADGIFDFRHNASLPYTASALTSSR